jgi:vacuolar-type H+-ATPase subunit F/Vma7
MNASGLFVIGDENAVFGFGLLGIEGQAVHSAAEAHTTLESVLARTGMEIVFVTDEWTQALRGELDRLRATLPSPLIVEIPGSRPSGTRPSLRTLIQQALGVQLDH